MATYDLTVGSAVPPAQIGAGRSFVMDATFTATSQALAQNDVAQLIDIPANTLVERVYWEVTTVEGAARNFKIGDGADDDGFITTTSANSLTSGVSALNLTEGAPNTITGYSAGKYYSAADTLDLTAVTAGGLTTCVVKVKAKCTYFG